MSVHQRARPAVIGRLKASCRKYLRAFATLVLVAFAAGCRAEAPTPFAGPDPADPAARVPATGYRSTIAPYLRQRPVDPAPWREQNEQVAPAPKP